MRSLMIKMQSAVIVLTWIVGMYIFINFWRARGELNTVKPQASQIIEAAKRTDAPVNQFITQLVDYSRTHPDILPIINKYQLPTAPASNPGAVPKPATTAAPAPGAAPKK